jgi:cytochrome P450
MPYTQALLNEVLRFSALIPTGVFHRCLEDKEFHGYLIPKGYWIIANVYSVLQNKELWGDPENFRPERFLSEDGKRVKKHEGFIPFLIGKRHCIGKDLAQDTLFLFLTSIYQHFYIKFDPNEPQPEFEPISANVVRTPHSFKVIMKERIL